MSTTAATKIAPIGQLALTWCKKRLPLQVMKSHAGHYLGTCDDDGPCSRESEYFRSAAAAQSALDNGTWTQRDEP